MQTLAFHYDVFRSAFDVIELKVLQDIEGNYEKNLRNFESSATRHYILYDVFQPFAKPVTKDLHLGCASPPKH